LSKAQKKVIKEKKDIFWQEEKPISFCGSPAGSIKLTKRPQLNLQLQK
jgi:hypothetical protein